MLSIFFIEFEVSWVKKYQKILSSAIRFQKSSLFEHLKCLYKKESGANGGKLGALKLKKRPSNLE